MPDTLDADLALARALAERAANAGSDGLASAILSVVAKLSAANVQNKVRQGDLIERKFAIQMARVLADITADELQDKFVGWEDSLERIGERFGLAVQKRPQLEYEPC